MKKILLFSCVALSFSAFAFADEVEFQRKRRAEVDNSDHKNNAVKSAPAASSSSASNETASAASSTGASNSTNASTSTTSQYAGHDAYENIWYDTQCYDWHSSSSMTIPTYSGS